MRFGSFAGNAGVKQQLSAFADSGHFPHALLLEGPTGCGKHTVARLIAQAIVCTAPGGDIPCGDCAACRKAAAGSHPDILEYSGGATAGSFHIDVIRTIRDQAYLAPNEADARVCLLFHAHTLSASAQNALLRILEDPPAHLRFILTCESRSQLLPTIQSRVQCLSLGGVTAEEGLPVLREQFPDHAEEELASALSAFGGCLGQAIDALSGGDFAQAIDLTADIAAALLEPTALPLLTLTARLDRNAPLLDAVLAGLRLVFRDALCVLSGEPSRLSTAPKQAEALAAALTGRQLMALLAAAESLQTARRRNMNATLLLTLLCSRLYAAAQR